DKISELDREQSLVIGAGETLEFLYEYERDESKTDIDADLFRLRDNEDLLRLEERLGKRIVDQSEGIGAISRVVRIAKAGLKRKQSPVGSFIFAGPTGVGKTQLAETLAGEMGMAVKRIDFGQMTGTWDVARLVGAAPGLVGYDDSEGELIEHMKKNPRSVIIFDEIDKADRDTLNILLQIMEDGRLTSNKGTTVRFNEAVIILTTNLGMEPFNVEKLMQMGIPYARAIAANKDLKIEPLYDGMTGAVKAHTEGKTEALDNFKTKMKDQIGRAARFFFRPEFLNRIDGLIVFNPLLQTTVEKIAAIFVDEVCRSTENQRKIKIKVGDTREESEAIIRHVAGKGYTPRSGARDMGLMVEHFFADQLTGFINANSGAVVAAKGKGIIVAHFDNESQSLRFELTEEAEEAKAEIPAEDTRVMAGIAERITKNQGAPLAMDDLKEAFGLLIEVEAGKGEKPVIAGKPVVIKNSNFLDTDPAQDTVEESITSSLPQEIAVPEGSKETPAKAAKVLRRIVGSWARCSIELAKMVNVASYAWHAEGRSLRSDEYYTKETGDLHDMVNKYFERIGESKEVRISWQADDDGLKATVAFNSNLSTFLKHELFGDKYSNEDIAALKPPRALQAIIKTMLKLKELGAKTGFYQGEGQAELWITVPFTAVKKSTPPSVGPVTAKKSAYREFREALELFTADAINPVLAEIFKKPGLYSSITEMVAKNGTQVFLTAPDAFAPENGFRQSELVMYKNIAGQICVGKFDGVLWSNTPNKIQVLEYGHIDGNTFVPLAEPRFVSMCPCKSMSEPVAWGADTDFFYLLRPAVPSVPDLGVFDIDEELLGVQPPVKPTSGAKRKQLTFKELKAVFRATEFSNKIVVVGAHEVPGDRNKADECIRFDTGKIYVYEFRHIDTRGGSLSVMDHEIEYDSVAGTLTFRNKDFSKKRADPTNKPDIVYPGKDVYFNIKRTADSKVTVEINEEAYKYFRANGANLDFGTLSVVPVAPGVPRLPSGQGAVFTPRSVEEIKSSLGDKVAPFQRIGSVYSRYYEVSKKQSRDKDGVPITESVTLYFGTSIPQQEQPDMLLVKYVKEETNSGTARPGRCSLRFSRTPGGQQLRYEYGKKAIEYSGE
ncbi:MAG: AAA family ATPase, partial [Candidatus Omnitrophica bacterium]|nr:AAA family ATPase [Candidatus Omnitrophota bacterium]